MTAYQDNCNGTFRNEGWGLAGSGVLQVSDAWSAIGDDTKYAYNPSNKGRACVSFPQDISNSNIPDGAVIQSVTLSVRAEATDATTRRLTVNLLCSEDTSKFFGRSFVVAQTPTTYQVATYTKDPTGDLWNKDRLNRMLLQCFTYDSGGSTNKVRVYEAYIAVNYRAVPVVKVTAPTGIVDSAAPVISWTYTQADGDIQASAQYRVYSAAQVAAPSFNPDVTPALYPLGSTYTIKAGDSLFSIAAKKLGDGNLWPSIYAASTLRSGDPDLIYPGEVVTIPGIASVTGDLTSFTLPFSLSKNDYYIFVRATSTMGARSSWDNRAFTVSGTSTPGNPGGSLGGVGTGGGGGFESVIADPTTSNVFLALRDGSNLMGTQQADFETLTDSNDYTATNCILAQDTTVNYGAGVASMSITASSSANMAATSGFLEIDPEGAVPLTARAQFLAIATGRTVTVSILFYDASFTSVAGTITASGSDLTTTWTEVVATGNGPSGAHYATVQLGVTGPANAEVHNADHIGLMYGLNSQWSNGGHTSRNLLTSAQCNADDPVAVEPWTADVASTYSRVATTGVGSDGGKCFKMLYAGSTSSISYVATGSAYTNTSAGSTFTLNKPSGVADGDVLVAYVASEQGQGYVTQAGAPSGWTVVDEVSNTGGALSVLMRDGLAADPTTWTGTLNTSTSVRKRAVVVAYRGAAPTSMQFIQEGVNQSLTGVNQTPTINNSDSSAWRLSAFAIANNTTGGSMTANTVPASVAPPIAYVGNGGVWKTNSIGTAFTLNKPSGVVSGDLMIAAFSTTGNVTVTPPSGWTLVRTMDWSQGTGDGASGSNTLSIMKRTAGSSEPSSWSGSFTGGYSPKISVVHAYRNCDTAANQFIAENGSGSNTATWSTPSVANTNSSAWRVSIFNNLTNGGSNTSSNENIKRFDDTNSGQTYANNLSVFDSNGTISTGSQQTTAVASNDLSLYSSASWIGILKPIPFSTPSNPNETERQDATAGASNPWVTMAVYDSNGAAATGSTTVYGAFVPGSGGGTGKASNSFIGYLKPAAPSLGGEVGVTMVGYVDISSVSPDVQARAGNQMTVQASFLGSSAGTPHLKLYSYIGSALESEQLAEGASFNTTTWTKASASFSLPIGTTRLVVGVSAVDRLTSDYVLFDRVSLAFGSDATYRVGTGRPAHPIFDVPVIEFAEDLGEGYGDWSALAGTSGSGLKYDNLTGVCTLVDQTMVPLSTRKYRAKTVSYGLAGDVFTSDYGPESLEVTFAADEWWIKDMITPSLSMAVNVLAVYPQSALVVTTTDTSAAFQPLGADLPLVVTEGYKGDVIALTVQLRSAEFKQFMLLINQKHTLYLQSNIDQAWWVRPYGELSNITQVTSTMTSDPLKWLSLSFIQVDPEV